jgi:hypothetical protein
MALLGTKAYKNYIAGEWVEAISEECEAFEVMGAGCSGCFDFDADDASVGGFDDDVDFASFAFAEVEEACLGIVPAELPGEFAGNKCFQQWSGCWLGGAHQRVGCAGLVSRRPLLRGSASGVRRPAIDVLVPGGRFSPAGWPLSPERGS